MKVRCRSRDDLFKNILEALREMPELLAQAFILSHYRGFSRQEIARELGIEEAKVTVLLNKANKFFYTNVRDIMEMAESPWPEVRP